MLQLSQIISKPMMMLMEKVLSCTAFLTSERNGQMLLEGFLADEL